MNHTAERWTAVPGYEGYYEVSDQGRVRSYRTRPRSSQKVTTQPRLLKLVNGTYLSVVLCGDEGRRTWTVHRLVALAFLGPCPDGMETRHLNGDAHDCRLSNLTYGTHLENVRDTERHGTAWYLKRKVA